MTQLNLSGRQSNNTQQKPAAEHEDESIKNQTVGALGALAMFAAVIVIGSCSRSSKPVAVQQPMQPTPQASVPAPSVPVPPPPTPVVAKTKKHRAATLSYINKEYGLSFNFPRNYQLKTRRGRGRARPVVNDVGCIQNDRAVADEFCPFWRSDAGSRGNARQLVSRNGLQVCFGQRQRESGHDL